MTKSKIPLAIVYDFDGTLSPGNMQEKDFLPKLNIKKDDFWKEVTKTCKDHKADNILIYMLLMLEKAEQGKISIKRNDFKNFGKNITFFPGIIPDPIKVGTPEIGWFDRINECGEKVGVNVKHFIVSSGIKEMIEGTRISSKFTGIFASSFYYDHNKLAKWPAVVVNFTSKTQFIFRINKKSYDIADDKSINKFIPDNQRPIPFKNIVYIGDGETDIPCFKLVKEKGGCSIVVYNETKKNSRKLPKKLLEEGRVSFIAPADYSSGKKLETIISALIDKISFDDHYMKIPRDK